MDGPVLKPGTPYFVIAADHTSNVDSVKDLNSGSYIGGFGFYDGDFSESGVRYLRFGNWMAFKAGSKDPSENSFEMEANQLIAEDVAHILADAIVQVSRAEAVLVWSRTGGAQSTLEQAGKK